MSDALADSRRFRILCVIDDFSRECLATVADNSISGERVTSELDRIAAARGYPCMIVSDNGTELTSNAILKWQEEHTVEWHYIAPGKPMQNGFVEVIQWPAARRVPQRAPVLKLPAGTARHRRMEDRLQPEPAAHEPRWAHANRVCNPVQHGPQPEQG